MTLFLTSTSRRRGDLLKQIGLVEHVDFCQAAVPGTFTFHTGDRNLSLEEAKGKMVEAAQEKVSCAYHGGLLETHGLDPAGSIIAGAVTAVFFNGRLSGKPLPVDPANASEAQIRRAKERAREMLAGFRGQSVDVLTGLAIAQGDDLNNGVVSCVVTRVWLRDYGDDDLEDYIQSGEPLDTAGGINLDGRGVVLVERIKGSPSNVAGLPLAEFFRLLRMPLFEKRLRFRLSAPDRGAYSRPVPAGRLPGLISPRLLLASRSPRRFELLKQIVAANEIEVLASGYEEHLLDESPESRVKRLAREKARFVWRRREAYSPTVELVIGADTEVVLDGQVLGQPTNGEEARAMLRALSGRTHQVLTGLAVIDAMTGRELVDCAVTLVTFRELTGDEIDAYVESGESDDKAGSYGIQSKGALFVEEIDGSYSNVVGLPLEKLAGILNKEFSWPVWRG